MARSRPSGVPVNESISLPKSPGHWVDEEKCICGETFINFRSWPDWNEACTMIRGANGGFDKGGGYRTRGPVLWAMHVMKLNAWYEKHFACGYYAQPDRPAPCESCTELCPWCDPAEYDLYTL